jgi:hypothetical protein
VSKWTVSVPRIEFRRRVDFPTLIIISEFVSWNIRILVFDMLSLTFLRVLRVSLIEPRVCFQSSLEAVSLSNCERPSTWQLNKIFYLCQRERDANRERYIERERERNTLRIHES